MYAEDWQASQGEQDHCIPSFYPRAVLNKRKTEEEGRSVFDEIDYVKILVPGDNKNQIDRKVRQEDKMRWPAAWDRYQKKRDPEISGTPLKEWAYLNTARAAELESLNIFSMEQLAGLSDDYLPRLGPGARDLVKRAQQFLEGDDAVIQELRADNQALRDRVSELEGQLETANRELQKRAPKRKPGRPPKNDAA
jgi:hypothetical protein